MCLCVGKYPKRKKLQKNSCKMPPIKVILFEDNKKYTQSLLHYFDDDKDILLTATFATADNAVTIVHTHQPDIVLMDINMPPGISGIEAMNNIRKALPHIKVLILTAFDDYDKIFAALCGGAAGYILKSTNPDETAQAIKDISKYGGSYFSAPIAKKMSSFFADQFVTKQPTYVDLTPRQKEVLTNMVLGLNSKAIASKMQIGYDTVRDHIKGIYIKLHVNSAPEAVREAILRKLI
jgi:DNA-binding NarL/FixJ family response regulator